MIKPKYGTIAVPDLDVVELYCQDIDEVSMKTQFVPCIPDAFEYTSCKDLQYAFYKFLAFSQLPCKV